jgi:hypothetical protein
MKSTVGKKKRGVPPPLTKKKSGKKLFIILNFLNCIIMSNVIMGFNYPKNTIIELLYQNINREIGKRDAERIIARIENESSRHMANVKFWYELIELEVTRMFYTEDENYRNSTPYTKYFTMMFGQAAENVEWIVNNHWVNNLENR